MALNSKEKRAAVIGVGRPWLRDKFPVATPDEEWRISSGNAYGGNLLTPVVSGNALEEIVTASETANATSITLNLAGAPTSGELLVIAVEIRQFDGAFSFPTGFTQVANISGSRGENEMAFKISDGGEGTGFTVTWSGTAARITAGMWVFSGNDSFALDVSDTAGPSAVDVITAGPTAAIAQADSIAVMEGAHFATEGGWDASPAPSFGGSASNDGAVDDAVIAITFQVAGAYSHAFITSTGTVSGTTRTHAGGSLSQRMHGIIAIFKSEAAVSAFQLENIERHYPRGFKRGLARGIMG